MIYYFLYIIIGRILKFPKFQRQNGIFLYYSVRSNVVHCSLHSISTLSNIPFIVVKSYILLINLSFCQRRSRKQECSGTDSEFEAQMLLSPPWIHASRSNEVSFLGHLLRLLHTHHGETFLHPLTFSLFFSFSLIIYYFYFIIIFLG